MSKKISAIQYTFLKTVSTLSVTNDPLVCNSELHRNFVHLNSAAQSIKHYIYRLSYETSHWNAVICTALCLLRYV